MGSVYTSRVSQKLAFARMHLHLWQQAEETGATQSLAIVQSFRESTLFHAVGAYSAFLQEIAHFYQLKADASITLEELELQLTTKSRVSPEVIEIQNILNIKDGWLAELLIHYQECLTIREVVEKKPADVTKEVAIPVMMLDEQDEPPLASDMCDYYLSNLREFINRLRESTMSEW
jgi:hypothetical protein